MAQLNRLTAVDYADADYGLSAFSDALASPALLPQLTLISAHAPGRAALLTPNRRLGVWICIASTVTFWSIVLALVL